MLARTATASESHLALNMQHNLFSWLMVPVFYEIFEQRLAYPCAYTPAPPRMRRQGLTYHEEINKTGSPSHHHTHLGSQERPRVVPAQDNLATLTVLCASPCALGDRACVYFD